MSDSSSPRILADVNVWLATLLEPHPHHAAAVAWWRDDILSAAGRVFFCRITQLSLLRLLCNRAVMGSARRTPDGAWADYGILLSQAVVGFHDEPDGLGTDLHELTAGTRSSPGSWNDAYLAAFARRAELRLATFDRGFRRFRLGSFLILLS